MHTVDAVADSGSTVSELRQHASTDQSAVNQLFCLGRTQPGNKGRLIVNVAVQAFDIRQERQLFRTDCLGNGACRIIRIDVVGFEIVIQADGRHNGKKVFFQKVIQDGGVNLLDVSHITDVLSVCILFIHL